MIPGPGAIDFPAVLSEIVKSNYNGWITVELYPYIDNPDAAGREAKQIFGRYNGKSPLALWERGRG